MLEEVWFCAPFDESSRLGPHGSDRTKKTLVGLPVLLDQPFSPGDMTKVMFDGADTGRENIDPPQDNT